MIILSGYIKASSSYIWPCSPDTHFPIKFYSFYSTRQHHSNSHLRHQPLCFVNIWLWSKANNGHLQKSLGSESGIRLEDVQRFRWGHRDGEHSLLESFSLFLAPFEPRDSFSSFIEFWFHWALLSVRCTVGREAAYMLRIGHWMVGWIPDGQKCWSADWLEAFTELNKNLHQTCHFFFFSSWCARAGWQLVPLNIL